MRRHKRFRIHRAPVRRMPTGRRRVNKFFAYFLLVIILLALMIVFMEKRIRPTVIAIGQARSRTIAMDIINEAVKESLTNYGDNDLFYITTDNNQKIAMVEPNTLKINKLVSDTIKLVQERLNDLSTTETYIYFGSVFDSQLFANTGPKIYIKLYPVGSVNIDYNTTFDKAGINQTRYMLELVVNVKMQMVAPFINDDVAVSNNVPIAEIIIVGDVPESYFDVNGEKIPTTLLYPSLNNPSRNAAAK